MRATERFEGEFVRSGRLVSDNEGQFPVLSAVSTDLHCASQTNDAADCEFGAAGQYCHRQGKRWVALRLRDSPALVAAPGRHCCGRPLDPRPLLRNICSIGRTRSDSQ